MKQFVFVLVLAFLGLALAAPRQDDPPKSVQIVGGDEISIEDAPYQVALLRKRKLKWTFTCGGTLIAPRVVVTAAHCVDDRVIPRVELLTARIGSSNRDEGGSKVRVRQIVVHPKYADCLFCTLDYDIAILFLNSDAIVEGGVSKAIELVETNTTFSAGTNATVTGWGKLSDGGESSPVLRSVTLPLVSQSTCRKVLGDIMTERSICAGLEEGGKDACQGDYGGPLTIDGKLAGVASFGDGCAKPGSPGAYTNIAAFRDWIKEVAQV